MNEVASIHWQPFLIGSTLRLRPLVEEDFESLFAIASDPLIWEQHPDRKRYTRERFQVYFRSGMESKGALAVIDQNTGKLIGSSRYTDYLEPTSSVEIGFTFLTRDCWGGAYNRELKTLMLDYAFQYVENVYFVAGKSNYRSQKAIEKVGGIRVVDTSSAPIPRDPSTSVVFCMKKSVWSNRPNRTAMPFAQKVIQTSRMTLEPIIEDHAEELTYFFSDPELHHFVPFEPPTVDQQRERCARWSKRRSPDGKELWLNWAGRDRASGKLMAHFQAGLGQEGVASVGYMVARKFQGKGFATEGVQAVFDYLRDCLGAREVKAWSDTRNKASHRLAEKLGMSKVDFVKNADFFKGVSSDEFVFSKELK